MGFERCSVQITASAPHSWHLGGQMPATTARCGGAPASCRAGDQDLGRGPTLTTTGWAGTALGDYGGGQTVAEMARLLRAAEVRAVLSWGSALALAAVLQLVPAYR